MKLFSKNIINNVLDSKFGGYTSTNNLINNMPLKNFHLGWKIESSKSKYLHLVFVDYDAIPVCGKPWLHWLVANIDLSNTIEILESESINNKNLIQGVNSLYPEFSKKDSSVYYGPFPPDKDHEYTLHAYTTDTKLNLKNGYFYNEFYKEIKNHNIFEITTIDFIYKKINN